MSKNIVPCGGFKLDNNFLGVNENDELSLAGGSEGKAYQQLVTDGDGNAKWEDRLAYDDSKVVIDHPTVGVQFVKVADEIPSWASVDVPIKLWGSDGTNETTNPEQYTDLGNGSFTNQKVFFITTDNLDVSAFGASIVFPEKGVYFGSVLDKGYITGIASADSDTPEITWDGNIETIKTIDSKYIPSELNEVILPSSTPSSTKKFKITVDDSGAISATEVTT